MALEKPMDKEQGWETINAPDLHTWTKPGETIFGKLLSVAPIDLKGKRVVQYILAPDATHRIKMLATYDLSQKLTAAHRGMQVRIKYLGEDETVKRGDNAMKVFDVQVRKDPDAVPGRDTGPITDEDIPF